MEREKAGNIYLEDDTCYPLYVGHNLVGRYSETLKNDIGVMCNDAHLGRQHFMIEVKINETGQCDYILSDYRSKNGTSVILQAYKLKKELKEDSQIYLRNGDIVVAGKTKFRIETTDQIK